jgi:hypothetical protein
LAFYFLAAFIDLAPWKLPNKGKTQVSAPAVDARLQSIKFKGILASAMRQQGRSLTFDGSASLAGRSSGWHVERERATAGKAASN